MNTFAVSARDIQRNYRDILERVKQTGQSAILMSQKEPQAAIVSLEDLEKLTEARRKNSAKALLELAQDVRGLLKDETLPADLAQRHDDYLWEGANQT
jgi:prevent-host-death family protein